MENRSRQWGFSERLYRTLLVAYPKKFRRQYGEQLEQAFGDLCREEVEQRGKRGLLILWIRTLGDLAISVFSVRSGLPVFSLGGIRAVGMIIMLGGVLQFVAWTLFFGGIRLRPDPTSRPQFDILVISPGATAFPLLAIGLLVLGVSLARRAPSGASVIGLLSAVGVCLAIASAAVSVARILAEVLMKPPLPLAAGPPFSPGVDPSERPFGQPVEVLTDFSLISLLGVLGHLEYWTLALAGIVLGGALLFSGVAGRWWVLPPLMGLLAVPQVLGLLRGATLLAFVSVPGALEGLSGALLVPHAMVAVGWMGLGLLLVSRRGERLEEFARIS